MNDFEQEQFEMLLRKTQPAKPPKEFMARLLEVRNLEPAAPAPARNGLAEFCSRLLADLRSSVALRWAAPITALLVIAALAWRLSQPVLGRSALKAVPVAPTLTADDVQIGEKLVSSFDTVACLPGGEPVRFRCRKWMDEMVVHDKKRGVVIEKRTPRIEVVPISYETY